MKNRAKCKLCGDIIESFHSDDRVSCKCGEIVVDGGDAYKCAAKDFNNFLRIDDEGNEIVVTVKTTRYELASLEKTSSEIINVKPTKNDLMDMLEAMIKHMESLPAHALTAPITHYDHCASLMVLLAILRSD